MRRAFALATEAVRSGNHPFGALLVLDGTVAAEARNTVHTGTCDGNDSRQPDLTQHAETNLVIKVVALGLTKDQLARATLVSSTEPCPMCSGAIYWAGIGHVAFGVSDTSLLRIAGDALGPCRAVFARGVRTVRVQGPLLEAEGLGLHEQYWPTLADEKRESENESICVRGLKRKTAPALATANVHTRSKQRTEEALEPSSEEEAPDDFETRLEQYKAETSAVITEQIIKDPKNNKPCAQCGSATWQRLETKFVVEKRSEHIHLCRRCVEARFDSPHESDCDDRDRW